MKYTDKCIIEVSRITGGGLMIVLKGKVLKNGAHWLIELPVVDAMTQGLTREDAFAMLQDYLASDIGEQVLYEVNDDGGKEFEIGFNKKSNIIPWILKRAREKSGKSLASAAEALGVKGKNAFSRYEKGESDPTALKLSELLEVTGNRLVIE